MSACTKCGKPLVEGFGTNGVCHRCMTGRELAQAPGSVSPEEAHAAFNAEYERYIEDMAKLCECPDGPCAGVLAGGMCDSQNAERSHSRENL